MKKTRRTLALILALALAAMSLSACSSSDSSSDTTAAETEAAETTAAETEAAESEAAETTAEAGSDEAEAEAAVEYDLSGEEITFVIPYGDSSGTNTIWRAIGAAMEEVTGCTIVYENQEGASGSVGTTYFLNQEHDGTKILCTSESVSLYQAQQLIDVDYDDLEPLLLASFNCGILVTYPGSTFDGMDFDETIAYIQEHPGEVTVGSTGLGGMAWVWWTLLDSVYDLDLTIVDYDSSGDGNTQLMGGHIDLFINGYTTGKSLIDAGSVVPIVTLDTERLADIDAPAISEFTDAFDAYMPYGSYFVAEVAADTPSETVEILRAAFMDTYNSDTCQEFLDNNSGKKLGLTGDEANEYMKHQQAVISWMLYDTGNSEIEPTEYGVARPE
ncbi:MAG: tripartite tricarboxylate transporter substrate binding protein [Lachnospiraceae bacterium]|nr:tripartite tricarboxylate transporter substrate binding protein [Lachnospiraceae bacterium]